MARYPAIKHINCLCLLGILHRSHSHFVFLSSLLILRIFPHLTFRFELHWRPFYLHCRMCGIQYDAFVHLETISEEAPFVLRKIAGALYQVICKKYFKMIPYFLPVIFMLFSLKHVATLILSVTSCGSRGVGKGAMPPPVPVKTSHKQRWPPSAGPLIFGCFLPPPPWQSWIRYWLPSGIQNLP